MLTSVSSATKFKLDNNKDTFSALCDITSKEIGEKQKKSIQDFTDLIKDLKKVSEKQSIYDVACQLLEKIDLEDYYCSQSTSDSIDRWENVQELLNSIQEYCDTNNENSLSSFLEDLSLYGSSFLRQLAQKSHFL